MSATVHTLGIDRLSVEERSALVAEIWDGIAADPENLPLSDSLERELDHRITDHEQNPQAALPWQQVRDEALARFRR